eukprot:scaffold39887_cov63-Phaeocystis_antarctica.AAC.2
MESSSCFTASALLSCGRGPLGPLGGPVCTPLRAPEWVGSRMTCQDGSDFSNSAAIPSLTEPFRATATATATRTAPSAPITARGPLSRLCRPLGASRAASMRRCHGPRPSRSSAPERPHWQQPPHWQQHPLLLPLIRQLQRRRQRPTLTWHAPEPPLWRQPPPPPLPLLPI